MLRKDPRPDTELLKIVWDYMSVEIPLKHADIIVVGGGHETGPAHYAAELYHMGFAPLILFSGYQRSDMDITEADQFAQVARQLGVPDSAIIREPLARNTGENITCSAALLAEKGITPERVILVHKPYMARRFLATAEAQWPAPQPEFIIRHQTMSLTEYTLKHNYGDVLRKTLGDFSRMAKYAKKGYQAHHDIPAEVQEAYQIMLDRNHQIR
jgi:uncharacterized SAM-binding protein YcdF (DUF218 family)